MSIQSAGLLLYRRRSRRTEVFLVHMGGPIWAKKDTGAWSIPKGLIGVDEAPLEAAIREFREETGFAVSGAYEPLGTFRQKTSKHLTVWALEGDCDPDQLFSNTFSMSWPPKSGKTQSFPEADRGGWFKKTEALERIVCGQRPVLEALFTAVEDRTLRR